MSGWEDTPCQPCHGVGHIAVEDGDSHSHWEPCPFCHGTANAAWLDEKRASRVHVQTKKRRVLLALTIAWVIFYGMPWVQTARNTYGDSDAWAFGLWVLLGAVLVFAWVVTPSAKSANRAANRSHAPGFTDNREVAALGLFAGALAARRWYDHSHQQQATPPPPPPQDVQSSWPAGPQVRYPTAGESLEWNRYRSEGW